MFPIFHGLFRSLFDLIQVITSRRMGCTERVALKGEKRSVYRILVGKLMKRDYLEDLDVNRRIMLKWIFSK